MRSVPTTSSDSVFRFVFLVYLDVADPEGVQNFSIAFTNHVKDIDHTDDFFGPLTFLSVGELGQVSRITETAELVPKNLDVTLSGLNPQLVERALSAKYQGRRAKVWMKSLGEDHQPDGSPAMLLFKGSIDVMEIKIGEASFSISVRLENDLIKSNRNHLRTYNQADHQRKYYDNKSFEFVVEIAEGMDSLLWGLK